MLADIHYKKSNLWVFSTNNIINILSLTLVYNVIAITFAFVKIVDIIGVTLLLMVLFANEVYIGGIALIIVCIFTIIIIIIITNSAICLCLVEEWQ